jgi:carbon storage regulator
MLVLSRHEDEAIVIGNGIEVVVVRIDANSVRIGIRAPKDVAVHRKEVYMSICENNQKAVSSAQKKALLCAVVSQHVSKGLKDNIIQNSL